MFIFYVLFIIPCVAWSIPLVSMGPEFSLFRLAPMLPNNIKTKQNYCWLSTWISSPVLPTNNPRNVKLIHKQQIHDYLLPINQLERCYTNTSLLIFFLSSKKKHINVCNQIYWHQSGLQSFREVHIFVQIFSISRKASVFFTACSCRNSTTKCLINRTTVQLLPLKLHKTSLAHP